MSANHQANESRLIANEIMRQLYEQNERGQLEILMCYAKRCIELIDEECLTAPRRATRKGK